MKSGPKRGPDAPHADRSEATYRGGLVTPPLAKPQFTLTDTSGAPFDFRAETQGHVMLLFFGYTRCPDVCPLHMANIAAVLKQLPTDVVDKIKVVFVTTDPARDTPAVLRTWLDHFDKRFIGLTGSDAEIRGAQQAAALPVARKARAPPAGIQRASWRLARQAGITDQNDLSRAFAWSR